MEVIFFDIKYIKIIIKNVKFFKIKKLLNNIEIIYKMIMYSMKGVFIIYIFI